MVRNTSDSSLAFDVDGVKHTARPGGPVTPQIESRKIEAVMKRGLPIEETDQDDGSDEDEAPPPPRAKMSQPPRGARTGAPPAPPAPPVPPLPPLPAGAAPGDADKKTAK